MRPASQIVRAAVALLLAGMLLGVLPALPAEARGAIKVIGREVATSVERQRVVELPIVASHVALQWRGAAQAEMTVAFSRDGQDWQEPRAVVHDDSGGHGRADRVDSGVVWTGGANFVRIVSDRPVPTLTVMAINSTGPAVGGSLVPAHVARAAVSTPQISSRAHWKADESLRFDSSGSEIWPAEFQPLQKLTVHHTAGANNDPDPEATVRAIYYHQAINRGWGDIGYNFLIDEAGRIYEGRYSGTSAGGQTPTGEDAEGRNVIGAHVLNHNAGALGVALLGNLMEKDATPAARAALAWLLAWKAERHGIDPLGSGLYTNPVNGYQKDTNNISGHRDWTATLCPGDRFYATLPALRQEVAARMAGSGKTAPWAPTLSAKTPPRKSGVKLNWTAPYDGGSAISQYRILRWKKDRFVRIATVGAATLAYRDTSTRSGRTYRYVVRAVNSIGKGPRSNEAAAAAR